MSSYQNIEYYCQEMNENEKAKEAGTALQEHKMHLKKKAKDKIEEWKRLLDESLASVNKDIDQNFDKFEKGIGSQSNVFNDACDEGQNQMTAIKDILDRTMSKMQMNANYVAYEIMDKDPLNEHSVEYLSS